MTVRAILRSGVPEVLTGPFTDEAGVHHSAAVLLLWSDDDLRAIGVYRVVADAVPAGKVVIGASLVLDGDIVRRVWTLQDAPPPPPPQVPGSVTRYQLKAALRDAGKLAAALAAVDGSNDATKLAWAEADRFKRSSTRLNNLATAIGMTQADLDDLFFAAVQIEA